MIFTKPKAYFLLQLVFIVVLLLYQLLWFISPVVKGSINTHQVPNYTRSRGYATVHDIVYVVNGQQYFVRENETPLTDEVRYNFLFPGYAILNDPEYLWLPVLIIYAMLFIATTIIFSPVKSNQIIPNGSSIILSAKDHLFRFAKISLLLQICFLYKKS